MTKPLAVISLLAYAALLTGCGSSEPESFDAQGTLTFHHASQADVSDSKGTCVGAGANEDVTPGAKVIVEDHSGKRVAVGSLDEEPGIHQSEGISGRCIFTFSVAGIPSGQGPYAIVLGDRGEIAFNESEAKEFLKLTLG
jgi:serine/threonine-protein kinase